MFKHVCLGQDVHQFDLHHIKLELNLNFYHQVKLINYIRHQVSTGSAIITQCWFGLPSVHRHTKCKHSPGMAYIHVYMITCDGLSSVFRCIRTAALCARPPSSRRKSCCAIWRLQATLVKPRPYLRGTSLSQYNRTFWFCGIESLWLLISICQHKGLFRPSSFTC